MPDTGFEQAIKIEVQPASVSVFLGESVQLTAVAYDRFDNVIKDVELSWEAETGLTVDQTGKVTYEPKISEEPPLGLVAWWPGDGNGKDVVGNNDAILNVALDLLPPYLARALAWMD